MKLVQLQMRKRAYDLGLPLKTVDYYFGFLMLLTNGEQFWNMVKNTPEPFVILEQCSIQLGKQLAVIFKQGDFDGKKRT